MVIVEKATTKQNLAVKGSASAADMAARPFQCEWHQGCSKVNQICAETSVLVPTHD